MHSNGMAAVGISNGDVDGVLLSISPSASITGRLRVEGGLPGTTTIDQLQVSLRPTGPNRGAQQMMREQLSRSSSFYVGSEVRNDGTFRIDYLIPGEYRLDVEHGGGGGLDAFAYVREARFDGADILNNPLRFSLSSRGDMDVVVSVGGGRLGGVVTDVRSQTLAGVRVVVIPERGRDRADLYRTAVTDSNGRFYIAPVAPGDYKLFAWESIEQFAWFDPEVLARFESRGRSVHITENSNETVDLRIIPSDGAR